MNDEFSPLTEEELAAQAASGAAEKKRDPRPFVRSSPDAPPPPKTTLRGWRWVTGYMYRDANGAPSLYRERLERQSRTGKRKPKKTFMPHSLRQGETGPVWVLEDFPDGELTPLFNLPDIVAISDKPVVMVEGEKAVEAAGVIFGDAAVVTTISNGNSAWRKTDLGPAAGRKVLLWPDNDDAGKTWQKDLGVALTALGCEVSVVDVEALIAIDGGARGVTHDPKGWDAADAAVEWTDLFELLEAVQRCAGPFEPPDATPDAAPDGKQWFEAIVARAFEVTHSLRDFLAGTGQLFDRGGPVRVVRDHNDDQPKAVAASDAIIRLLVHEKLQPYKYNSVGERVPIMLPSQLCDMYRSLHGEWGLPLLAGITSAPILSEDGSIRTAEGFDPTTGLWCHSVPDIAGLVPEEPTEDQARLALAVLREAHKTFSFADAVMVRDPGYAHVVDLSRGDAIGQDEGAGLCAELTSVCRPSLETAPGVLVHGPNDSGSGVGKGLYVRYNAFMAFGIKPYAMGPGHGDDAEREKRIAGALLEGGSVLFLDNWNELILSSNNLESALTERLVTIRRFGTLDLVRIAITQMIFLTGNALQPGRDMLRRVLPIEMNAHVENPNTRKFRHGQLDYARAHRPALLVAALTIWRWGRRSALVSGGAEFGSYNQWTRWVRDPLLALGVPDPVRRIAAARDKDPVRQAKIEVFDKWWAAHESVAVRASALADSVKAAIASVAHVEGKRHSDGSRQGAAAFCHRHIGSQIGGYELELVEEPNSKHKSGGLYRLKLVSDGDDEVNGNQNTSADADIREGGIRKASAEASANDTKSSSEGNGLNKRQKYNTQENPGSDSADDADDADDSPAYSEKFDSYNLEALKTSSAGFKAARVQDQKFIETMGESSASSAESPSHTRKDSSNNRLCSADALADALRMSTRPDEHPQNPPDVRRKVTRKKSGSKIFGLKAARVPTPKPRPK
jgi:putative DNA primase/helicase